MLFTKYRVFCLVLICTVLSGCAEKKALLQFVDFPDFFSDDDEITLSDSETSMLPPEELLPEPVESESCIVQELNALKQTGSWIDKQEKEKAQGIVYDFPIVMNKQVTMYIELFQNKQKKYFSRWLARSTRYLPLIHDELKKAGLPLDLAYLAMIESGFNQRAYSRARAVGMWQFMKGTGRDYNLRIDRYVDERRDAVKSTRAAAAFLKDLHEQFGDWHLAVAAYNAGPGKIRKGIRKYKTRDFWEIAQKRYLRLETKRYVPKLIAAIIIAKEPEKYGFTDIDFASPLEFDTIEVGPGLSIKALATISGGTKKELMLLNQELKTGKTPLNRSKYIAHIPKNSSVMAAKNLSRLHSIVKTGYKTHVIRKGETLTAICKKYSINKTTLLKVNSLQGGKLANGQRLRIPYSIVDYQLLPESGPALVHSKDSLILHTIKSGETISKIAKQYSVPPEMIVAWNGLKSVHRIRAGQQLALYIVNEREMNTQLIANNDVKQKKPIIKAKNTASKNNVIVLADSKKKAVTQLSDSKQTFSIYQVQAGDTLWKISRKFNISTTQIKTWNNLKSNIIHPGNTLKLKDV